MNVSELRHGKYPPSGFETKLSSLIIFVIEHDECSRQSGVAAKEALIRTFGYFIATFRTLNKHWHFRSNKYSFNFI